MNITSLILSPDFQTRTYGAELYYVDIYKLQWLFYDSGGFGEKGHDICKIL